MRRTPRVVVVPPWIRAGLDAGKPIAALIIGEHASAADEVRIERRFMLIVLVLVAAGRVRLPDLDQRVGHGATVFIQHAPADDDALAERFAGTLLGEIFVVRSEDLVPEQRTGDFGKRWREEHEGFGGRPPHRGGISRIKVCRLGTGGRTPVAWNGVAHGIPHSGSAVRRPSGRHYSV